MKAMIDKEGKLSIERAGEMRNQACPYSSPPYFCGDWCALFGEPSEDQATDTIKLEICGKATLVFSEFNDER